MGKRYTQEVLDEAKRLYDQGKTWNEVAALLTETYGWRVNPDRLRKAFPAGSTKTFEQKVETERAKMVTDAKRQTETSEVKRAAFNDLFLAMLERAVTPLRFIQQKLKLPQGKNTPEEAVLILSDLHFGKKTALYDIAEARRRFRRVRESLVDIITIHRNAYPIKKLHIIWNGDIVDGEGIYPTQPHHVDGTVGDQIFGTMETVVEELALLASFFDEVKNYCVRGNHGRMSKFAHEDSNFDNIFYRTMKVATKYIPNMTWDIPAGWYALIKVLNTRFLVVHGHQIKMTLNLPWYGITTRISRWATTNAVGEFDVAVLGHFHTSSRLRWNNKKVFTNGTLAAGDEFALEVLGLESSECQWLMSVHPTRGITWAYEIDVK